MPRKRLVLHIGMHRTGSTSLQRYFARNRRILRRLGVCYPNSYRLDGTMDPKHNAAFLSISHEADFGRPHDRLGPSHSQVDALAEQIRRAPGRYAVISAEGFSGERPVFAAALAPLAEEFDCRIVIFLRAQDDWVESFYKQMVINRQVKEVRPFTEFLEDPSTQAHVDYDQIIRWWEASFGAAAIHPTPYSAEPFTTLVKEGGLPGWLRWLPHRNAFLNSAPSARSIEMMRRANAQGLEAPRDAAKRLDQRFGRSEGSLMSDSARAALKIAVEPGNRRLENRYDSFTEEGIWAARHTTNTFHEWNETPESLAQFWTKFASQAALNP